MFLTFFGGEIWKILISPEIKVYPKGDLTFMSLLHTISGVTQEEEAFFKSVFLEKWLWGKSRFLTELCIDHRNL